jgi:hypothetical protein
MGLEGLLERVLVRNWFDFERALGEFNWAVECLCGAGGFEGRRFGVEELRARWTEAECRVRGVQVPQLDLDELD